MLAIRALAALLLALTLSCSAQTKDAAPSSAQAAPSLDGQTARLAILSEISSKSPNGASFMARLDAPLQVGGKPVLEKGSLFEGHLETKHARFGLRPGALRLIFDRVKLPDGTIRPVNLALIQTSSQAVKVGGEGTLHPTVSKKRLAIQLGGAALAAKLADDISEEALAANDNKARFYGLAGAAVFLVFQKGREAKLKAGDVIDVEFGRSGPSLPAATVVP